MTIIYKWWRNIYIMVIFVLYLLHGFHMECYNTRSRYRENMKTSNGLDIMASISILLNWLPSIMQEALRSSMECSIVPTFKNSCKAMFDQVDATFQKGLQ